MVLPKNGTTFPCEVRHSAVRRNGRTFRGLAVRDISARGVPCVRVALPVRAG